MHLIKRFNIFVEDLSMLGRAFTRSFWLFIDLFESKFSDKKHVKYSSAGNQNKNNNLLKNALITEIDKDGTIRKLDKSDTDITYQNARSGAKKTIAIYAHPKNDRILSII